MSAQTHQLRSGATLFEFPLNERFRAYLRLDALYQRWQHYLQSNQAQDHHSALMTLFEINDFAFRYDLKSDLIFDINRYKLSLNHLRHLPDLSEQKLVETLLRLSDAQKQIEQSPKFGSGLSDNDWLLNVKTRMVVPGGVCSSDIGFYYQWLQQPAHLRRMDLETWWLPLAPLFETLQLVLMIVRNAMKHKSCETENKAYQLPLNGTRFDLLQVKLPNSSTYLPDISANKHVIWLRFTLPSYRSQPQHLLPTLPSQEIHFDLNLCGM